MTDLAERIRDHYDSMVEPVTVEEILGAELKEDLPSPVRRSRSAQVVALIAAAAAIVGLAVAVFLNGDGDPTSVITPVNTGEPTPTLDSAPAPDPPVTQDALEDSPTNGTPTGAGDGPRLTLTEVPLDEGSRAAFGHTLPAGGGVWFDGALYVLGSAADATGAPAESVLRTSDGFDWEVVADLDELRESTWERLVASDDLLVAYGGLADGPVYGEPSMETMETWGSCAVAAGADVAASADGETWTQSRLDLPVFDTLFDLGGCVHTDAAEVAIGAGQALVVNRFETRFDEHTYSGRLLADLQPDLDFSGVWKVADESTPGEAVLDVDGQRVVIPFDDEAFADAQRRYDEFIAAELGNADAKTFAWTSPDGVTWSPLEPTGPLAADREVANLIGTPDGFYLRTEAVTLEHTPDLVNWEVLLSVDDVPLERWGELAMERWGDEIVLNPTAQVLGTDRTLFPADVAQMAGHFGEFGVFGIGCPAEEDAGCEEPGEFFYSDGDSWSRWRPTELDALGDIEFPTVIGMGDDFVVLQVPPVEGFGTDDAPPGPLTFVGRLP